MVSTRRTWIWVALPAAVLVAAVVAAASGGSSGSPGSAGAGHQPVHARTAPARLSAARPLSVTARTVGTLPAAVQDAAVASLGANRLVLLGGLDSAQTSTSAITTLAGAAPVGRASLLVAQHDAQAAPIAPYVYVFGGGEFSSYDHILRYDPASGNVTAAGTLPSPASDVAVAAIGDTAYVVGGFDGVHSLDTILAWRPGTAPRIVGRLPAGLRYAAVAAITGRLIIAGGTLPTGVSDAILRFDPLTGAVARIGTLPHPLTHASAALLAGRVVIVGGRRQVSGGQTAAILTVDQRSGSVRAVGHLPQPLSDAAVAAVGGQVLVAGGASASGAQSSILAITPNR